MVIIEVSIMQPTSLSFPFDHDDHEAASVSLPWFDLAEFGTSCHKGKSGALSIRHRQWNRG
jgi:hypothetical protein